MDNKRGFASDNNAGVHPRVMEAIMAANDGHTVGYGGDVYTREAISCFKQEFGDEAEVFFVFNGTGANVVALQAICRPYQAIIATSVAHINVDECGAPEKLTGSKILTVDTPNGKLTVAEIDRFLHAVGVEHHVQPKVVSVTQSTEMGTVYTLDELKEICDFAHAHGLWVHMDGARLANGAASLGCSLRATTRDVGVDVLSFGGTKNGMMMGEAVVFLNPQLSDGAGYVRKQSAQLMSKMRFMSVQFTAMFKDDLWRENALHSNKMAGLLAHKVSSLPFVTLTQRTESNGVFARIPREAIAELQSQFFFYIWDPHTSEVRWMTAFDTTEQDIDLFAAKLKEILNRMAVVNV
ncbi:MAG: low specificity L-threonine aldolase [Breznakibacter sp.]